MLAALWLSAAVLVGAALSSVSDPGLAGEAALARLAGEVADGAVAEWQRLRRDAPWLGNDVEGAIAWPAPASRADDRSSSLLSDVALGAEVLASAHRGFESSFARNLASA